MINVLQIKITVGSMDYTVCQSLESSTNAGFATSPTVTYLAKDVPKTFISIFHVLQVPFFPTLSFIVPHPRDTLPIIKAEVSASIGIIFDVLRAIVEVIARVVYVELKSITAT